MSKKWDEPFKGVLKRFSVSGPKAALQLHSMLLGVAAPLGQSRPLVASPSPLSQLVSSYNHNMACVSIQSTLSSFLAWFTHLNSCQLWRLLADGITFLALVCRAFSLVEPQVLTPPPPGLLTDAEVQAVLKENCIDWISFPKVFPNSETFSTLVGLMDNPSCLSYTSILSWIFMRATSYANWCLACPPIKHG